MFKAPKPGLNTIAALTLIVYWLYLTLTYQEEIHPQMFCHKAIVKVQVANKGKNQYKCQV